MNPGVHQKRHFNSFLSLSEKIPNISMKIHNFWAFKWILIFSYWKFCCLVSSGSTQGACISPLLGNRTKCRKYFKTKILLFEWFFITFYSKFTKGQMFSLKWVQFGHNWPFMTDFSKWPKKTKLKPTPCSID